MNNLLTINEFVQLRNISQKVDDKKLNEAIKQAQGSDLIAILGDFYFDVVANMEAPDWQPLLDGCSFAYCGKNYYQEGIRALLADYVYARFIAKLNVNLTPFGVTKKKSENSEPLTASEIRDISKQSQIDAGIKFEFIKLYLLSKPSLFSRYCENTTEQNGYSSIKISKL